MPAVSEPLGHGPSACGQGSQTALLTFQPSSLLMLGLLGLGAAFEGGAGPRLASAASLVYAMSLKAFFYTCLDYDPSITATLLDVLPIAGCTLAVTVLPSTLSARGWTSTLPGGIDVGAVAAHALALLSLVLARRLYTRQVVGKKFKAEEVTGRVYIVTGSNTGLGYETAKELVRMGGVVIMACRSVDRAKVAREALLREVAICKPNQLAVLPLDLNSFASVRAFVQEFEKLKLPLHCLINNAGLMMSERSVTPDGHEVVMTANHLSAFLLTSLLVPALEAGAKKLGTYSRIINVSSSLHQIPKAFNFDDVMSQKHFELFATYSQSKLANILFTRALHKRLTQNGLHITANTLHPGFVRTEVTRHMNAFLYWGDKLATPIMLTLQKTPPQGAYCTIHLAISPLLEGRGGAYFVNSEEAQPSAAALSDVDAERLWTLSDEITKAKWSWK